MCVDARGQQVTGRRDPLQDDCPDPGLVSVRGLDRLGPDTRRVNAMSIKLTDTQLVILSAAAQRDDRCLTVPKSLKGASAQKVASKLLAAGLVKEIKAKPGMAVWRRDEEAGQSFALKLTAAGMKAIAVEDEGDAPPTASAPFRAGRAGCRKGRRSLRPRSRPRFRRVRRARGRRWRGSSACYSGRAARRSPN